MGILRRKLQIGAVLVGASVVFIVLVGWSVADETVPASSAGAIRSDGDLGEQRLYVHMQDSTPPLSADLTGSIVRPSLQARLPEMGVERDDVQAGPAEFSRLPSAIEAAQREWPVEPWMDDAEYRYGSATQKRLHRLQHPTDCSTSQYVLGHRPGGSGFGSRMWYYRMCLTKAFVLGRVYVQTWSDRSRKDDSHSGSWTNCTLEDVERRGHEAVVYCRWPEDNWRWWDTVPSPYQRFGLLWWQTQTAAYLLRPSADVQDIVNSTLQQWGLQRFAGIHARYGDDKRSETRKPLFHRYLRMIPPSYEDVFMASDVLMGKWKARYNQYRWLEKPPLSNKKLRIAVDLALLSVAGPLIFTYSSNFGQMALHLYLAADFCRPYAAVDNAFHSMGKSFYLLAGNVTLKRPYTITQWETSAQSKNHSLERRVAVWHDHVSSWRPQVGLSRIYILGMDFPFTLPFQSTVHCNCPSAVLRSTGQNISCWRPHGTQP